MKQEHKTQRYLRENLGIAILQLALTEPPLLASSARQVVRC